jgi:AraC-like DNA-binding protein
MTRGSSKESVGFLWLSQEYTQPHAAERLLPTGGMSLVFSLDPHGQIGGIVSGARSASIILDTSKPLSLIGVSFTPGAGFPFFDLPAGELQDQAIPLEAIWGQGALALHEQLLEAVNPAKKLQVLESALQDRLHGAPSGLPAVRYAVNLFQDAAKSCSIGAVIERTGLTAGRFIKAFRDEVGLTPKVFSRIARFRRVVGALDSSASLNWSGIAAHCGYFDQAHFIHDFRAFAGVTPSDYLRNRTSTNHIRIAGPQSRKNSTILERDGASK